MSSMITLNAASLDDVWRAANRSEPGDVCYRGQSNAQWELIPSVFRPLAHYLLPGDLPDLQWVARCERDIYREFELRGRALSNLDDRWELLCLAQHHGVPTRLLDWTKSLAVALFFSVADGGPNDAAVWCFDLSKYPFPEGMGRRQPGGGYRIPALAHYLAGHMPSFFHTITPLRSVHNQLGHTSTFVVIEPPAIDRRIEQQEGLLSMYLNLDDSELEWNYTDHLSRIEIQHNVNMITKIVIPQSQKDAVRSDLEQKTRLSVYRLFPDLSGLGRWLNQVNKVNLDQRHLRRLRSDLEHGTLE